MWNRTRRLQASPFLARTDTNTARAAAEMSRNLDDPNTNQNPAVTVNMGDINNPTALAHGKENKKKHDTLFGPNIGIVSSGPAWTEHYREKNLSDDQLTPEVVKSWITKSKEPSQPTTTLQALVNLKRPSLRLTPLTLSPGDDPESKDSLHHHGLEFEFDCDAPKCGIYVHVHLTAEQAVAERDTANAEHHDHTGPSKVLVFESIVDGGFGKILKLEEGATLELGTFEQHPHVAVASPAGPSVTAGQNVSSNAIGNGGTSVVDSSSSFNRVDRNNNRKRFSTFNFRRRQHDRAVAGPSLAVVDAESHTTHNASVEGKDKTKDDENNSGVRVTIRLIALDEEERSISPQNEQVTYLHIVRFGHMPAPDVEDTRPWVVKVVKREATIGVHTFQLHEIYGLASQSTSHALPPMTPPPDSTHTYPPAPVPVHEDDPSSECLLCLSSPREVVLLPCRHLVACKECAINMVEYGAGGQLVHADVDVPAAPPVPTVTAGEEGGAEEGGAAESVQVHQPAPLPVPTPQQNPRRKRKAKGWFCPVCRQPYTSLLRITTTPPSKEESTSNEYSGDPLTSADPTATAELGAEGGTARSGFVSSLRPGFLRTFTRNNANSRPTTAGTTAAVSDADAAAGAGTLPPDLERGDAAVATGTTA